MLADFCLVVLLMHINMFLFIHMLIKSLIQSLLKKGWVKELDSHNFLKIILLKEVNFYLWVWYSYLKKKRLGCIDEKHS